MSGEANARPCFFLQFAGQGTDYMDELRSTYQTVPAIRPFILQAIDTIRQQASRYDDSHSNFFSRGLDIHRWLDHPQETPDRSYLLSSPVSYPLIFLCQISSFFSIFSDAMDQGKLLQHTHSATGFSSGIMAAALSSLDLPLNELKRRALLVQAMFVWGGVRVQQCTHKHLVESRSSTGAESTSCMVTIGVLPRHRLQAQIGAFARRQKVTLAYKLSMTRSVIAGREVVGDTV